MDFETVLMPLRKTLEPTLRVFWKVFNEDQRCSFSVALPLEFSSTVEPTLISILAFFAVLVVVIVSPLCVVAKPEKVTSSWTRRSKSKKLLLLDSVREIELSFES